MMQEVSLTGATLLEDNKSTKNQLQRQVGDNVPSSSCSHQHPHHHHHHHHHQDPLAVQPQLQHEQHQQQQVQQVHPGLELTAQVIQNSSNGKPCCNNSHSKPVSVVPKLTLTIPVQELVQQPADSICKALWQVVRVGSFDLWLSILEAWQAEVKKQQTAGVGVVGNNKTTSSMNETPPLPPQDVVYSHIRDFVDAGGHSFLHWATKRVDEIRFCQFLAVDVQSPIQRVSQDPTAMTPLHWSCTLPYQQALPMIRILLSAAMDSKKSNSSGNNNNIPEDLQVSVLEMPDATGCTPLLIAAQHGHVETVAYLLQKGASVMAVDHNRDSAVHWAAYKGSSNVLGLLTFYDATKQFWTAPDVYGQMPLHLAALRGHTAVCRYILQKLNKSTRDIATVLHHTDKNGRTPLALAVHKEKPTVAAVLQQAEHDLQDKQQVRGGSRLAAARLRRKILQAGRSLVSTHEWKVWLGLPEVDDVDESPKFPYYYVWFHICANLLYTWSVFWPLWNVGEGVLWDKGAWQVMSLFSAIMIIYTLRQTTNTNPGRLDAHHPRIAHWRRLYEATLESYADDNEQSTSNKKLPLCHTCHIARPPRCKHDRFTRACIEQFDHHCPFVSASVGLYNYRWFLLFLTSLTAYFILFWIVFVTFVTRHSNMPWVAILVGLFLGIHAVFPVGMWIYHVQLVIANLTTNEHANRLKYDYLWETTSSNGGGTAVRRYRNPFHRGVWQNFMSRLFPSEASYRLPDDEDERVGLLEKDSMV